MSGRRLRVLHVVESFDGQAIEAWLLRALAAVREQRPAHHWTFYCAWGAEGERANEARALGADVRAAAAPVGARRLFFRDLRGVMKAGHFDVLDAHHDTLSALYLAASAGLPLRRVVHVHNTQLSLPTPSRFKAALTQEPLRRMCLRWADHVVGVSSAALGAFLHGQPPRPPRDLVLHCGIAPGPVVFSDRANARAELRAELGLPPTARVLLFVGRMIPYKNPRFVMDVLAALADACPDVVAVFAGRGAEVDAVEADARARGLKSRIRLLGWRDDVQHLLRASDVLLWPGLESPMEGLGLGVVEAQAVGVPVVVSHSVPSDAVVIPELVTRLELAAGASSWADAARAALQAGPMQEGSAHVRVDASTFGFWRSARALADLHEGVVVPL